VWVRGIVGVVLCLVGAVWVAQGTGALHGSGMSGHGQYTVLGALVIVIGLLMLVWADRARRSHKRQAS
jgi:protein-S-isoprenylcysteine O-methyltransferase Ste14